MLRRWLVYVAALAGCVAFFIAYAQWLAWVLLLAALCLPVLSLLLSLPGMLTLRLHNEMPAYLPVGSAQDMSFSVTSALVPPPYRCRLRVCNLLTGETALLMPNRSMPTACCGKYTFRTEKSRVYDYLGLFFLRIPAATASVTVRPEPVALPEPPQLEQYIASSWRPKVGGGFSENHELRLYRPGDNLNQVHWKLTAKTGKLMIREPMIPANRLVRLDLELRGDADELNRKLGIFLWLSEQLLDRELPHQLRALTGEGILRLNIEDRQQLFKALDRLLATPVCDGSGHLLDEPAAWQYTIGGAGHEA